MTTTELNQVIEVGGKFVACWGYDQTQYSVYNVVGVSGKSVLVEGLNSWSNLSESDLAAGSKVKVYSYPKWEDRNADEWGLNIDEWDYNRIMSKRAKETAPVQTIVKMNRIDGESWTYIWTLDNGQVVNSRELYDNNQKVEIVKGVKKCLVQDGYGGQPAIKLNESIRAYYEPDYNDKKERYDEQNEYTAYNGR